jgi:hypothetical protein
VPSMVGGCQARRSWPDRGADATPSRVTTTRGEGAGHSPPTAVQPKSVSSEAAVID